MMDFVSGVIWALAFVAIFTMSSKMRKQNKKQDPRVIAENTRLEIVRAAFIHNGRLVEDIMLSCLNNKSARKFFQEYHLLELKERRNAFCELCLRAAVDNHGVVEGAYLSQEFSSAWRIIINFLPSEFQRFYKTTRPISTFNPHDTLIETDDPLDWATLHLPESGKLRDQRIKRLVQAFAVGKIILRFRRGSVFGEKPFVAKQEMEEEKN